MDYKNRNVQIKCTYANAFAEPYWNKYACVKSYDKRMIKEGKIKSIIGRTTGKTFQNEKDGKLWIEAELFYTNRLARGWFRLNDVDLFDTVAVKENSNKKSLLLLAAAAAIVVVN